jgi:HAD superfamily hydrolase (TIGR01458 family)
MTAFNINGKTIQGFLIDLDGVLYEDSEPVAGAVGYMHRLVEMDVPFRYITNTTRKSLQSLTESIQKMSFPVDTAKVFSAPVAAKRYVSALKAKSVFLLASPALREDFEDVQLSEEAADVVLMGDPGDEIDLERLNKGFRFLMEGAEFVAMQKNRYWKREGGLSLDAGAFVAALEYASGKRATVIGKPAREFFSLAVSGLDLPAQDIAMIGDDIETDIRGAQESGLTAILVQTGKYSRRVVEDSGIRPDLVIGSFPELKKFEI